jgi:hypothetical protein
MHDPINISLLVLFHLFLFLIFWTQKVCLRSSLRVAKISIDLTGTMAVVSELFRLFTKIFVRIATNWIKSVILPDSVARNYKIPQRYLAGAFCENTSRKWATEKLLDSTRICPLWFRNLLSGVRCFYCHTNCFVEVKIIISDLNVSSSDKLTSLNLDLLSMLIFNRSIILPLLQIFVIIATRERMAFRMLV